MEEDPTLRECPECQELVKPAMLPCEARFRNWDASGEGSDRIDQWVSLSPTDLNGVYWDCKPQ